MAKIAILGLGESLALYPPQAHRFDMCIGVNDIWAQVPADYVVCVDHKIRFTPARLAVIEACTPLRFYSQLPEDWGTRPDFHHIELQPMYPNHLCQLDTPALPKSLCSPFVAAAIAYKLHGATSIELFGVDLLTHPLLKDDSLKSIVRHFGTLRVALAQRGVSLFAHGNGLLRQLNK
jgi:hypothetical protein